MTSRSAPTSCGLSMRIGIPVRIDGPDHEHLVPEVARGHQRPLLGQLRHGGGDDRAHRRRANARPRRPSRFASAAPSSSPVDSRTVANRQCSATVVLAVAEQRRSGSGCCRRRRPAACAEPYDQRPADTADRLGGRTSWPAHRAPPARRPGAARRAASARGRARAAARARTAARPPRGAAASAARSEYSSAPSSSTSTSIGRGPWRTPPGLAPQRRARPPCTRRAAPPGRARSRPGGTR